MPPRAIWSSVIATIFEGGLGRVVRLLGAAATCWSSRNTRLTGSGNLGRRGLRGLKPNPPYSGSNCSASCLTGPRRPRSATAAACGGCSRP